MSLTVDLDDSSPNSVAHTGRSVSQPRYSIFPNKGVTHPCSSLAPTPVTADIHQIALDFWLEQTGFSKCLSAETYTASKSGQESRGLTVKPLGDAACFNFLEDCAGRSISTTYLPLSMVHPKPTTSLPKRTVPLRFQSWDSTTESIQKWLFSSLHNTHSRTRNLPIRRFRPSSPPVIQGKTPPCSVQRDITSYSRDPSTAPGQTHRHISNLEESGEIM